MSTGRDPQGMTRRQLMRHSAWFGAAVVLTVAGGEVISHVAGTAGAAHTQARPTLRFAQISDSHIGFTAPPTRTSPAPSPRRSTKSTASGTRRIS